LVDYGSDDQFLKDGQLLPENFLKKAREVGYDEVQIRVRKQEGYDHSYYFVSPRRHSLWFANASQTGD
jgi:S-formylglutathione hydrolase